MSVEIRAFQIGGDKEGFEKAIASHIANLHDFNKTVGKPRPTTHPLVESAIKRIQARGRADAYVPDFTYVVDIHPETEERILSLEEKKIALHNKLTLVENEAKFKVLPQRKIRLATVKMAAAWKVLEDERTAEQNEDIASYLHLQKVWDAYNLIGAQAESDIDDLTEDTIDSWQPPTFG